MKTRIGFTVLLSLILTGACASEETVHNGFWWEGLSENFKLGFVTGFSKAMTDVFDAYSFECLAEKTNDAIRQCAQTRLQPVDFTKIRLGQLSEGLDAFYKDFRNKGVGVSFGIRYVRDQLKSIKSEKELEEELATYRSLSHQ